VRKKIGTGLGVMVLGGRSFPAWQQAGGARLVDLRMEDAERQLTFQPDALRQLGLDEATIFAASQGSPPGLVTFGPDSVQARFPD